MVKELGVAYYGNLFPDRARSDIEEMIDATILRRLSPQQVETAKEHGLEICDDYTVITQYGQGITALSFDTFEDMCAHLGGLE